MENAFEQGSVGTPVVESVFFHLPPEGAHKAGESEKNTGGRPKPEEADEPVTGDEVGNEWGYAALGLSVGVDDFCFTNGVEIPPAVCNAQVEVIIFPVGKEGFIEEANLQ